MKFTLIGVGLAAAALAATLTWGLAMRGPEASEGPSRAEDKATVEHRSEEATMKTATFGGGCFWCTEAVFEELKGVRDVVSGYAGGTVADPTYQQVCEGTTGHAEVVQITYDPEVVSFAEFLEVFWKTHDPTTLNRQGNDVGTQYRSIILSEDEDQKKEAESYKAKLNEAGAFPRPIVTQIVPLERFYPAEAYHQDYYRKNPSQAYCQFVIAPKMEKFRQVFAEKRKKAD